MSPPATDPSGFAEAGVLRMSAPVANFVIMGGIESRKAICFISDASLMEDLQSGKNWKARES